MKKAVIIGARGFGGLGLIEIIRRHPFIEIAQLIDLKDPNKPISDEFPHLRGLFDMEVQPPEKIDYRSADIAFFSTPDRVGMSGIHEFYTRGIPVIDFSGDFRFSNSDNYAIYAKNKGMETDHKATEILSDAVYGLPEKFHDKIRSAKVIGNPGCFAINAILALLPVADSGMIQSETIICDGKTGVSGAGKNSGDPNLYPQRYENMNTYREGRHQHLVEIENLINWECKKGYKVLFVPQIVPLNRGILSTIYADIDKGCTTNDLLKIYSNYYAGKPFVTITDRSPNTTDVRGSNRCEIRPMVDPRTGKLFITSVIDNLVKGQAGNAIQNANIVLGIDETAGLDVVPFYP